MAIIDLPFPYEATIIRPRCRNEETVELLGWMPVRLREVTGAEAPVVVRFEREFGNLFDRPPMRTVLDYRVLDGQLMRPFSADMEVPDDGSSPHVPVTADGLQDHLNAWHNAVAAAARNDDVYNSSGRYTLLPEWLYLRKAYAERDVTPRRWISDTKDAQAAKIRRAIEQGAALVDGVFYVPSKGPAWVVKSGYNHLRDPQVPNITRVQHYVALEAMPEYGYLMGNDLENAFRCDRVQEALAQARREIRASIERARRHNYDHDILGEPVFRGALEVKDHRHLSMDDDHTALHVAASTMLGIHSATIGEMAPDTIHAYADLKRLVAVTPRTGDDLAFEGLLMTAIDLRDRVRAETGDRPWPDGDPIDKFLERHHTAQQMAGLPNPDALAQLVAPDDAPAAPDGPCR